MASAATLYLEVNADKVKAGAAQAATSLRTVQQQASATGAAMQRAALSNQAYTLSVDAMSGELVRIPVLMEDASRKSSAFGSILSTMGRKLTDVGGYAKSFASHIKGMLLGATVFSAIAAGINLVEGAITRLFEPTEEETKRIKAMTAAVEEFRAASDKIAGSQLAQKRYEAVGNQAGARSQREQRLREVIAQYESAISGVKGGYVGESFFTNLGVEPPKGGTNFIPANQRPLSGGTPDVNAQGLMYVPERQFKVEELNARMNEYVETENRAIETEKKAAETATATGKARLDVLTQLAQAYNRLHGISESAENAAAAAGKVGASPGAVQAAVATYENIVARLRTMMPRPVEKDTAAEDLKRKSDDARNRLHEQQLADMEASDAKLAAQRKDAADKATAEADRKFSQSASGFASGFESATSDLLHGMTSVGGAFEAFAQSIAEQVLQQAAIQPAGQAVGAGLASWLGSLGSSAPAAYGKVFDRGVTPFAAGGVVTRPTHFAYGGGIGLMGEEGPEAVVPLKRGRDGRLGIAGGSGPTVINVNVSGVDDHRGMRPAARQAAIALDRNLRRR